jgi:excisionase family DNA binding protein
MIHKFSLQFSSIFSILATIASGTLRAMSEILTVREVAALLKINEKTAYKLAAKGEIPGFKVGGSWRFDSGEIDNWIRRESAKHGKVGYAAIKSKKSK